MKWYKGFLIFFILFWIIVIFLIVAGDCICKQTQSYYRIPRHNIGNSLCAYFTEYALCCKKKQPFVWQWQTNANTKQQQQQQPNPESEPEALLLNLPTALPLVPWPKDNFWKIPMFKFLKYSDYPVSSWHTMSFWGVIQPQMRSALQSSFKNLETKRKKTVDDDTTTLFIHYRLGDIVAKPNNSRWNLYKLLKYSWYRKAIEKVGGLLPQHKVVVVSSFKKKNKSCTDPSDNSQIFYDNFCKFLLTEYPGIDILRQTEGSTTEDFRAMMEAPRLIGSISSFSFMAGMGASDIQKLVLPWINSKDKYHIHRIHMHYLAIETVHIHKDIERTLRELRG